MAETARSPELDSFLELLRESRVAGEERWSPLIAALGDCSPSAFAGALVERGVLNDWQAEYLLSGQSGLRIGNYLLTGRVGLDSLGERFSAWQESLHRKVDLQILPASLTADQEGLKRFLGSARRLTQLDHPAILHLYDVAEQKGRLFIVSEFCEEMTAPEFRAGPDAGLQHWKAARDLLSAIEYLHQQGLTHGFLEAPGSLRFTQPGSIKIDRLVWSVLQREMISRSLIGSVEDDKQADRVAVARWLARLLSELPADSSNPVKALDSWRAAFLKMAEASDSTALAKNLLQKLNQQIERIEKRGQPAPEAGLAGPAGDGNETNAGEQSAGTARPAAGRETAFDEQPAVKDPASSIAVVGSAGSGTKPGQSKALPKSSGGAKSSPRAAAGIGRQPVAAGPRFSRTTIGSAISLTLLAAVVGWMAWNKWGPGAGKAARGDRTASRSRSEGESRSDAGSRSRKSRSEPKGVAADSPVAGGAEDNRRASAGALAGASGAGAEEVGVTPASNAGAGDTTGTAQSVEISADRTPGADDASLAGDRVPTGDTASTVNPDVEAAFDAPLDVGVATGSSGSVPGKDDELLLDPMAGDGQPATAETPGADARPAIGEALQGRQPGSDPEPSAGSGLSGTQEPAEKGQEKDQEKDQSGTSSTASSQEPASGAAQAEAAQPASGLPPVYGLQPGGSGPQILGTIPSVSVETLRFSLESDPETMGKGKNWFEIKPRGDEWQVLWSRKSATEELEPVARLSFNAEQQVVFQWESTVDEKHPANCLVNSFLVTNAGPLVYRTQLRETIRFDGLTLGEEKLEGKLDLDIPWLPQTDAIRLEWGEFFEDAGWTSNALFVPPADSKQPAILFFGSIPEEQLLWLSIDARVRARLEMEAVVQTRVGGKLVTIKRKDLEGFIGSFVANKQAMDAMVAKCEADLIDPPYGTKGKREDALKAARKQAEAAMKLATIAYSHQTWLQGVFGKPIPVRLIYPIGEQSIELALSSGWEPPPAPPEEEQTPKKSSRK